MNTYEAKLEARKARYEQIAENQRAKSQQEYRKADLSESATGIPFGQPILVGHHSESRHRNTIKRADNAMRRSIDADKKAKHYDAKADAVGTGGISSDDPEAVTKLQAKIDKAVARQTYMKAVNKAVRAAVKAGTLEDSPSDAIATFQGALLKATDIKHTESQARQALSKDFAGRRGFADYKTTNNNANIRRMKQRIETLKAASGAEHKETEQNGVKVVENPEENRLQLFFPGKPSANIRGTLKGHGFRWSRYNGCWQRHLNNAGRYAAECVLKTL